MTTSIFGISFDARDAKTAAGFWAEALRRPLAEGADSANAAVEADPDIPGSRVGFHQVPEGKTVKNRLHLDLITSDFGGELQRLTDLGATTLNEITAGGHWVTLADPEGNEFDLIES
jgi:predicted enzyme related to lactoylglutathione lyase